jgi:hypothetical protein
MASRNLCKHLTRSRTRRVITERVVLLLLPRFSTNSNLTSFPFHNRPLILPLKMDRQSVFSLSVLPPEYDSEDTRGQIQAQLEQFILQFRLENAFIYRSIVPVQLSGNS